jgi:hypothetical protein
VSPIVTHAVEYGLPPDIKAKWGPMTERTRRQRIFVAGILLVVVIAVVPWSLETLPMFVAREMTFTSAFVYFAIMFGTFNVLDCVVLDWGLVYWQPRFVVLPGTEGMVGYRSYWFYFRGFLIGIPLVLTGSAVSAAIVSIILRR